jgi:serine/threonine-protein kinase
MAARGDGGLGRLRRVGQFRIERKLAVGGFAVVYRALDTVEGSRVALKVPHAALMTREVLDQFRKEVRVNARLDHPNVLPVKYAGFVDGLFVIVYPLGLESLGDRLRRRVSRAATIDWAGQMLDAVAHAHRRRVFHGDLKPDNFVLFPGGRLRLADFGIARIATRTIAASGSGTVGYVAPEQAMGKPSIRSDVFSLGLVLYRLFTGSLPEWPFEWPPPGLDRLRRTLPSDAVDVFRTALDLNHRRRYRDADRLRAAFRPLLARAGSSRPRKKRAASRTSRPWHWEALRIREFQSRYRKSLGTHLQCRRCDGPVSDPMRNCPWCGIPIRARDRESRFPARCPRCRRGRKLDWRFCPWCYGAGFKAVSTRTYSDTRYEDRCANPKCPDRRLMPFMRYCPWCRTKVRRRWKIDESSRTCPGCGWHVLKAWWSFCPWCARPMGSPRVRQAETVRVKEHRGR